MTAFSIFVPSIFFGHFVLPFQTFRFVDYKFDQIAVLLFGQHYFLAVIIFLHFFVESAVHGRFAHPKSGFYRRRNL